MRVRDLGGPTAGDDPKRDTNCTFAARFFQTTVFIANKPTFFSAGMAGAFCLSSRDCHTYTQSAQGTLAWVRHRPKAVPLSSHLGGIQP